MNDIDEAVREFLVESIENMDQLDRDLVALEKTPSSREILARIFRTIHTIKGTCGFLGFARLEAVSHVGESLLSRLRDGALFMTPEITSALLLLVDAVRQMLAKIEAQGNDGDGTYDSLISQLTRLQHSAEGHAAPAKAVSEPRAAAPPREPVLELEMEGPARPAPVIAAPVIAAPVIAAPPSVSAAREPAAAAAAPAAPAQVAREAPLVRGVTPAAPAAAPGPVAHAHTAAAAAVAAAQAHATLAAAAAPKAVVVSAAPPLPHSAAPHSHSARPPREVQLSMPPQAPSAPQPAAEGTEARAPGISDSTIRVDVGLLDKLMNLVGELVLARNQILQFTATQKDTAFVATSQRLNLITTELQEGVMKTRMQPIGNIWGKFPRVVRDLAVICGKQVLIEMEGKETELDKTIIEAIKDPLTHLIRNGVDHGIEPPNARAARGKPPEGRMLLRAFHEGGQVNIEISDDGNGVSLDKVRAKAVQRTIVTSDQAARLSDRDALNLIFLPGFSTADSITNVSGRGVGMDVVKTNIEKIGGTIDVQSRHGQGTTFKIKIPLTLAIIPALIVTSRKDRFAIPQVNLLELVRLEGERIRRGIEMIHGAPVYRLRGNLLPLVTLAHELGTAAAVTPGEAAPPEDVRARETVNIVVLQAGDRQFGLVVDGINDTEEIVVKPLGKQLKGTPCFAGATIMGDGRVALILDVLGIAQKASVVSEVRERAMRDNKEVQPERKDTRQALLLFRTRDDGRMAIPLSLVARLEEFPRSVIERTGRQDVVQYRGRILPLVRLTQVLPERRKKTRDRDAPVVAAPPQLEPETLQVVVFANPTRSVGLVVDRILDIVEETLTVQRPPSRPGVRGSAVIQGRVTELLDVDGVINGVSADYNHEPHEAQPEARR